MYWRLVWLAVLALFMLALASGKGYPPGVRPIPTSLLIAYFHLHFSHRRLYCKPVWAQAGSIGHLGGAKQLP